MQWLFIAVVLLLLQTTPTYTQTCTQQFAIQEAQTRYFTIDVETGDVDAPLGGFSAGDQNDNKTFLIYANQGAALYSKGPMIIGYPNSTIPSGSLGAAIVGGIDQEINVGVGSMILGGSNNSISNSDNATILGSANSRLNGKQNAFIGGGFQHDSTNTANSAVIGGSLHTITANLSALVGGTGTSFFGTQSAALGGSNNQLGATGDDTVTGMFIAGGSNLVNLQQGGALVGGVGNKIDANSTSFNAFAAGGKQLTLSGSASAVGGFNNTVQGDYSFVGGGEGARLEGAFGAILGGLDANITTDYAFIGGGEHLEVYGSYGAAVGGSRNAVGQSLGFIGGGANNFLDGSQSGVVLSAMMGGTRNTATNLKSFVGGGDSTTMGGAYASVLGGSDITVTTDYCFAAGCVGFTIDDADASQYASAIAADHTCYISASSSSFLGGVTDLSYAQLQGDCAILGTVTGQTASMQSFVAGGNSLIGAGTNTALTGGNQLTAGNNIIFPVPDSLFMGGGFGSNIYSGDYRAMLAGQDVSLGVPTSDPLYNGKGSAVVGGLTIKVTATNSVVVGGNANTILGVEATDDTSDTTVNLAIIAGQNNTIDIHSIDATVLGGYLSTLDAPNSFITAGTGLIINGTSAATAFAAAGSYNEIHAPDSGVLAGLSNKISDTAAQSVIITGESNTITGSGLIAGADTSSINAGGADNAIVAGASNTISATGNGAFIAGGTGHFIDVQGYGGAILGGQMSTVSYPYTVAIGGQHNQAQTANSLVAGSYASSSASFNAGFVFADASSTTVVEPTADNMFIVRATGGATFMTDAVTQFTLASDATSWSSVSDRNKKENIVEVDYAAHLAKFTSDVPIFTYNYKSDARLTPHMGPMAQDMFGAFALGGRNTSISTLDADGTALAGIHGVYLNSQQLDERVSQLTLKARAQKALIAELTESLRAQTSAKEVLAAKASAQTSANAQLSRKVHAQQDTIVRLEALIESMSMKLSM